MCYEFFNVLASTLYTVPPWPYPCRRGILWKSKNEFSMKKKELALPKGYLSYSAMSLWQRSPEQYRARYYENAPDFDSPELTFGKHIAKMLEDSHESVAHVPRLPVAEYPFMVEISGVMVKGYIDTFDPEKIAFAEYKTGHLDPSGNPPWNVVKVRQHGQLTLYSCALEIIHKKVDPLCELIWLETEFVEKTRTFGKHVLRGHSRELKLTGRIERFPRKITKWERTRMKNLVRDVAEEISEDYKKYHAKA